MSKRYKDGVVNTTTKEFNEIMVPDIDIIVVSDVPLRGPIPSGALSGVHIDWLCNWTSQRDPNDTVPLLAVKKAIPIKWV